MIIISFLITQYNSNTHNAHTLTLINVHTQPYLFVHLRKLNHQILETDEVVIGTSLSTGTSPTESTTPLNTKIFAQLSKKIRDISGANFNLGHRINIQGGAQEEWEEGFAKV